MRGVTLTVIASCRYNGGGDRTVGSYGTGGVGSHIQAGGRAVASGNTLRLNVWGSVCRARGGVAACDRAHTRQRAVRARRSGDDVLMRCSASCDDATGVAGA